MEGSIQGSVAKTVGIELPSEFDYGNWRTNNLITSLVIELYVVVNSAS